MQGLFTQGPSVQDILDKRNKSQFDLQQQLMAQASQGARDPAKMRAVSLLGSSLGRALGGAMGGQDEEGAKRQAEIDEQERLQDEYAQAMSKGTPEERLAFGNVLIKNPKYVKDGSDIILQARQDIEDKKILDAANKKEADVVAAQKQADNELASAIVGQVDDSVIRALRSGGEAAKEARKLGYKFLDEQNASSSLAMKVRDAFGFPVGSKENMEQMQKEMQKSGQTIEVTVNEQGFQELTKTQKSVLQKEIRANKTNLQALDDISDSFDASYFTLQGQGWAKVGAWADKLGISPDTPLIGGAVDYNARKTTAVAQIDMLFNQYRKEITGAAAAVAELEALKKSYLNTDRGPEATLAMIAQLKAVGKRGYEEKKLQLGQGIDLNPATFDWNDPSTYTQEDLDTAFEKAKDAELEGS